MDKNTPSPHTIWIASFDIGKKTFSFVIEEVNVRDLENLKNVNTKYTKTGCTKEFDNLLNQVNTIGKIILMKSFDLTDGDKSKKQYIDMKWFINMNKVLDDHMIFWEKCTSFVIEQQMSFGFKKTNTMALKLGQNCISYFLFHFANFKLTVEFPSYHKTQVHGAPKKMTKYERKKWAVEKAMNMLISREDTKMLKEFIEFKKKDDVADCVLMLSAYKYLCYVDKSI
jgi:hypothetical protein